VVIRFRRLAKYRVNLCVGKSNIRREAVAGEKIKVELETTAVRVNRTLERKDVNGAGADAESMRSCWKWKKKVGTQWEGLRCGQKSLLFRVRLRYLCRIV
jgi:hypothetical protein